MKNILQQSAGFEWDEGNSEKNWIRHQVSQSECEQVFFNEPLIVSDDEKHSTNEKRWYLLGQTEQAAKQILSSGFELGLQMMIGLPGDSKEKSIYTAKRIVELGASNTRIYPTVVIRDTALHNWFDEGKYIPLSIGEAVKWTKIILPLFEESGVKVLRVGLHPSEGLLSGDELIAGPFHPSFKELVMTEIWSDLLKPLLQQEKSKNIEIRVPEKEINFAVGYEAKNKKLLLNHFKSVKFIEDNTVIRRNNYYVL